MFGPPRDLTRASTCPWIDRRVSGLQPVTVRPIQTRFRFGYTSRLNLATNHNSLAHDTKGTRSHIAFAIVLPLLVNTRFQVLFTPLAGVLFTFPSRYCFAIGRQVVLSLGRWSSQLQAGFHVSRPTRGIPRAASSFTYRALTFYGRPSHAVLLKSTIPHRAPTTPQGNPYGLGSSAFARRYLRSLG